MLILGGDRWPTLGVTSTGRERIWRHGQKLETKSTRSSPDNGLVLRIRNNYSVANIDLLPSLRTHA